MNTTFHYEVRITNIRFVSKDDIDFNIITKTFTDDDPFISRQNSLDYYVDYISGLLEYIGHEYKNDRQSREVLKSYFESGNKDIIITRDQEDDISTSIFYGIGVFFVNNKKRTKNKQYELLNEIDDIDEEIKENLQMIIDNPIIVEEQLIHGFGYYGSNEILPDNFIDDLWFETMILENNEIDVTGKTIDVEFFDDGIDELDTLTILPTPFDWSGYDKSRKNQDQKSKISHSVSVVKIEQLISNGESDQVEFKPSLLYNFKTKQGGIGVKSIIGRTICGFLNSRGGFLFIGLRDDGTPQGLTYDFSLSGDRNPRDFFRLEFDQMLEHFLPQWVHDNVFGGFEEINGVEVFVVSVLPSKTEPIFFKGQEGKEFYIRRMGSTKQLDLEQFHYYWKNHWTKKED